jgi:hypothetical protein
MQASRYATKTTSIEPPPEGTHKAVLVQFVELGMQPGYQGGADEDKVYLTFELPNTKKANGEPFLVGRYYSIKWGPKANWTKVQKALLGRTPAVGEVVTPDDLIGKGCQLVVVHEPRDDGGMVGKIESLIPLSQGDTVPSTENNCIFFDFEKKPQVVYDALPEFLQKSIDAGKPYPVMAAANDTAVSDFDDDIAF